MELYLDYKIITITKIMVQLIQQVILQFKSEIQYIRFIKQSQKEYTLKTFRLQDISFQIALTMYAQIDDKYSQDCLQKMDNGWHQYQRRLFIWFILCYMHYKLLDPIKFVHNQNYHKYWEKIAKTFWNKNISLLQYQLLTIVKTKNRITWNKQQDEILLELYNQHRCGQWNQIAKAIFTKTDKKSFKTAKHCRQRWQNHLNPEIRKGQWKNEEDYKILYFVKRQGCKWARIAQQFQKSRTQHMIKNRYKALMSKYLNQKTIKNQKQILNELLQEKQLLLSRRSRKSHKKQTQKMQQQNIPFFESEELIDEIQDNKHNVNKVKGKSICKQGGKIPGLNRSLKSQTIKHESKNSSNSFISSSFQRFNEDDAYKQQNLYNNFSINKLLKSSVYCRQNRLLPILEDKNISIIQKDSGINSSYAQQFQFSSLLNSKRIKKNQSVKLISNISDQIQCNHSNIFQKFIKQ